MDKKRPAKTGRTSALLVTSALVLVLALLWFAGPHVFGPAGRAAAYGPEHGPDADAPPLASAPLGSGATRTPEVSAHDPRPVAGVDFEMTFEGQGTIRGVVNTPPGTDFPERWKLTLAPARYLKGREHAVHRELEFTNGEREFEVKGLPLAGYSVKAHSEQLNGEAVEVLLFAVEGQPEAPGAKEINLNIRMLPAGILEGSAFDVNRRPVMELTVTLERLTDGVRREAQTDASGRYSFPDLLDGSYRILFGNPVAPLIPAEELDFAAPVMTYPDRELPVTTNVKFLLFDELGIGLPDASVRGYGSEGGTVDVVSDANGVAWAKYLRPGDYRVLVRHRSGRTGKLNFEITGEEDELAQEIMCKK